MAIRTQFENSSDVGVFSILTNSYCVVPIGGSENFYSTFEAELVDTEPEVPVIHASIAGCRVLGSLAVGNSRGLLVPSTTTDQELQHLRNSLPDKVVVQRVEERLSALGNCVACNDYVALVHPEMDRETEEIIHDVLGVDIFRETVAGSALVGTYATFSNNGGLVHPHVTVEEMDQLASLFQVPITAGTVNRGSDMIGAGVVVNDWIAFAGIDTTAPEISVIDDIFKLQGTAPSSMIEEMRGALIDSLA
ncbi:eukaryotic translation initiation factor 6-2 [Thecamonas trahens ATCC 50062]|uniref:Eukaryotic translation initiation factor 6 n=1 Tax=Thecamonas trahens ATCC 50062 TaxID=461836 RepID=A0A0L0D511_THETB|nr:eukaryotic translation initiation factor 6-2 [Thecamonas trahens ATCC 50062]KNC47419.1 eukaryotic translation initiation factor 6-2 [Thecamonas trahens ATCC 50062]|eukprot:XP_013759755.1 eukaryotic translation initiation factor 6-2 [Thecamonas trahens ATCC 50062]